MAKRSVRRQRRETPTPARGASAARPEATAPAAMWRSPAFWLGGLVIGLAVAAIAVAAVVLLGGDDETPATPAAATPAADDAIKSAEELEQEFAARDRQQIEELTNEARTVAGTLEPVMAGLEEALPRRGGPAEQVAADKVQQWLDTARDAAAPYQESISGGTGFNIARNTIRAALDGLVNTLQTYQLASAAGVDRAAVHEQAAAQRDNVIRTWSAAGIQIDAINIEAGFGHQHIEQLGGAAAGGQAPDTLPEGTDATHPE